MSRFPTSGHLVSWAKLTPRTIQSGARNRDGKTGKGNPYLKGLLGEAAATAARTDTFLGERYRRLVRRHGKLKALVAIARTILVINGHPRTRRLTWPAAILPTISGQGPAAALPAEARDFPVSLLMDHARVRGEIGAHPRRMMAAPQPHGRLRVRFAGARKAGPEMSDLDELVAGPGVLMARRFGPGGRVAEHQSTGVHVVNPALTGTAQWFCAAITTMFSSMAYAVDIAEQSGFRREQLAASAELDLFGRRRRHRRARRPVPDRRTRQLRSLGEPEPSRACRAAVTSGSGRGSERR
jgi:Transposase IS116/IS110/IS902 family